MRYASMLGSLIAAAGVISRALFGFDLPAVKVKTDPRVFLPGADRSKPQKARKISRYVAPMNGKREVERRLRQIMTGQLTRANGLRTRAELGMPEERS